MGNPFCHVELASDDPAKSKKFYKGLFDWGLEEMPMPGGSYTMINVGDGVGGGIMKNPAPGVPSHWLAYVLVSDVAATSKKAQGLGAKVLVPKTEVPQMGWFSVIQDPTGAALGLWQPAVKK